MRRKTVIINNMKVLIAASEVAPIIKIGGLGDVIGSLPKALEKIGINTDVIVPYFPVAKTQNLDIYKSIELNVPFNEQNQVVEVYKTKLPGSNVDVFLLKNSTYFNTGGTNFFANNISETEMFAFLDRCVVEFIKSEFNIYDVVHCNDWHTGLITHLLADELLETRPATIFTIHNLMYQGIGSQDLVREVGIVPGSHPLIDWDISDGDLNMVQQGVTSSDFINAVSESYAKEILTEEFGGFLWEILKAREARICGILNGLDYSAFPRQYTINNYKEGKAKSKRELIKKLGLSIKNDEPLYAFIGRIDPNQKGIDLITEVIPDLIKSGGAFVLLGTGVKEWEEKLVKISKNPELSGKISVNCLLDIELANLIYSGSDFLLVPSKYEPCGLIQMIAMWYGSLPIVHAVGGLKDTVKEGHNGFSFENYTKEDFQKSINRSFEVFKDKDKINNMIQSAMTSDFSWDKSAKKYAELYQRAIEDRRERTAHEQDNF